MVKWASKAASDWWYIVQKEKVLEDAVRKMAWDRQKMIDKSTSEVLGPKVDYSCYKDKF